MAVKLVETFEHHNFAQVILAPLVKLAFDGRKFRLNLVGDEGRHSGNA